MKISLLWSKMLLKGIYIFESNLKVKSKQKREMGLMFCFEIFFHVPFYTLKYTNYT